jgi:hypothetical protein
VEADLAAHIKEGAVVEAGEAGEAEGVAVGRVIILDFQVGQIQTFMLRPRGILAATRLLYAEGRGDDMCFPAAT